MKKFIIIAVLFLAGCYPAQPYIQVHPYDAAAHQQMKSFQQQQMWDSIDQIHRRSDAYLQNYWATH